MMDKKRINITDIAKGRWIRFSFNPCTQKIETTGDHCPGNYLILVNKKINYIGKSQHILKRIASHQQSLRMGWDEENNSMEIAIRIEKTGSERHYIEYLFFERFKPSGNGAAMKKDLGFLGNKEKIERRKNRKPGIIEIHSHQPFLRF